MRQGASPLTRVRAWQLLLLVAVVYGLLAHLGEIILPFDGIAALWPASGFSAVMVLWAATRTRRAVVILGIVLGVGLSIAIRQMFLTNEVGYLLGNVIEPLVMLPFIQRVVGPSGRMERLSAVAWLAIGGVVATGVAAAAVAAMATWSFDGTFDPAATLGPTWRSFFTGDLLGMLLVAPVLLQLQPPSRLWSRGRAGEQAVLWALLVVSTVASWFDPMLAVAGVIVVILMAVRLDSSASFVATLVVAASLVVAFLRGTIIYGLRGVDVIDVRLVLPLIAIVTQIVALATSERLAAVARAESLRDEAERTRLMLGTVLAAVPVGMALYDVAGDAEDGMTRVTLAFVNEEGRKHGANDGGADGNPLGPDVVNEFGDDTLRELALDAWTTQQAQITIVDSRDGDGPWRGVWDCSATPVGNDRVLVEWTDVTELAESRHRAVTAAAEAEASRTTLQHALDSGLDAFAIFEFTDTWRLVFVNAAGASRSESSADDLVDAPPSRVLPVEAHDQIVALMDVALSTGEGQQSVADLTGSGSNWRADFDVTVTPTSGERVVVTWRDMTELQTAYRSLRSAHAAAMHAATHDPLTNLPNRPLLIDRLSTALSTLPRTEDCLAVVYLDVDGFKLINDRHGHAFGDAALMAVARRLRQLTREGDTAARIAGDEFVLVLTGLDADWPIDTFHDRLTAAMAAPVEFDGVSLHLSLSAGVAITDGGQRNPESLLLDADLALYASKSVGNGRITLFTKDLRNPRVESQPTVEELLVGLSSGELVPVYQPVVDLASGTTVGHEALIRWNHPRFGVLSPSSFLDLAERSGLIADVGSLVLRHAIANLADRGTDTWVSVNLAPSQVLRANLSHQVTDECLKHAIDPSRLVLEVTETQLLEATPAVLRQLESLRSLGCRIAIDDFGTGYSSIAYLESFDVDIIKIDRGLIEGPATDRKRAMIEWVTSLATTMGCATIAEGIETEEQAALVRAARADMAQGYLFGRPLTVGAATSVT